MRVAAALFSKWLTIFNTVNCNRNCILNQIQENALILNHIVVITVQAFSFITDRTPVNGQQQSNPRNYAVFHVVFLSMLAKLPILFEHSPILPIWNILIRWVGTHRWKVYVQDDTCLNCWRWNYFKFNKLCSINLKLQQFYNSKSNQFERSRVTFTQKKGWYSGSHFRSTTRIKTNF